MKTIAAALLLSVLAFAADVTGNYSGTFTQTGSDGQPRESGVYIVLKQAGAQITGSGGLDASRQFPIRNGKIAGTRITGEAVDPEGPVYKLNFTVVGDKLEGDADATMPDGQVRKAKLSATRVK